MSIYNVLWLFTIFYGILVLIYHFPMAFFLIIFLRKGCSSHRTAIQYYLVKDRPFSRHLHIALIPRPRSHWVNEEQQEEINYYSVPTPAQGAYPYHVKQLTMNVLQWRNIFSVIVVILLESHIALGFTNLTDANSTSAKENTTRKQLDRTFAPCKYGGSVCDRRVRRS